MAGQEGDAVDLDEARRLVAIFQDPSSVAAQTVHVYGALLDGASLSAYM
jgi:hypothetical protein